MKWRHCQTVALWSAYCQCDDNFLVIFLSTNFRRWRIAGSYSHQVVNFLGFEILLRFLDVGDLALWLSLLLFLILSRFSPCHLFYYNSFPVLVKSHGLLIYITANVFPTGSSPPVGDFQQKLLPPRTIQPHNYQEQYNHTMVQPHNHQEQYCAANQPSNKTSTLSHKTSNQQSYHTTHTTN